MLDENVSVSVSKLLINRNYECSYIRELLPVGSVDQLVAFVAEDKQAILVSHDGDFKKISPRIPDGQKKRFRNLSRIHLRCAEYQAADRLEKVMNFIISEYKIAQKSRDKRMMVIVGNSFIRSER